MPVYLAVDKKAVAVGELRLLARGGNVKLEPIVAAPRALPAFLPFLFLAVAAPFLFFIPITHDAIWQLWIGDRMLHGARLYSDIIEVNPPLWFWLAVPLAAFHADPRLTIIGFFIGAMALSLYLTPAKYRLFLLPAFTLLPLHDFCQREHFTLIAAAPYVFLIGSRVENREVRHPLLIGILAGLGLALKPWFVFVPLALEALLRRHVRPETVALGVCAVLYMSAIVLFAPAYLTDIVPLVRETYSDFSGSQRYFIVFLMFGIALVGMGNRRGSGTTRALAVAALAFLPAFVLQQKGWAYHSLPARGFLFLAIATEISRERRQAALDGVLVAAAALCFWPFSLYNNVYRVEAARHLAGVPRGSSIVALVSNPSMVWPMVEERGLDWQLHEFSVWQINAAAQDSRLVPEVRAIVAADLAKRPHILILDNRPAFRPVAHALIPAGYLNCYRLKVRGPEMESFVRKC